MNELTVSQITLIIPKLTIFIVDNSSSVYWIDVIVDGCSLIESNLLWIFWSIRIFTTWNIVWEFVDIVRNSFWWCWFSRFNSLLYGLLCYLLLLGCWWLNWWIVIFVVIFVVIYLSIKLCKFASFLSVSTFSTHHLHRRRHHRRSLQHSHHPLRHRLSGVEYVN